MNMNIVDNVIFGALELFYSHCMNFIYLFSFTTKAG